MVRFIVKRLESESQAQFELKVERFHNLTLANALNFTEPFTNVTLPTTESESLVFTKPVLSLSGENS